MNTRSLIRELADAWSAGQIGKWEFYHDAKQITEQCPSNTVADVAEIAKVDVEVVKSRFADIEKMKG